MEHVALVMESRDGDESDYVSLMTLHGAKGLEFDAVFLPGWEEGLFPSQRSMDEHGMIGLEEELTVHRALNGGVNQIGFEQTQALSHRVRVSNIHAREGCLRCLAFSVAPSGETAASAAVAW